VWVKWQSSCEGESAAFSNAGRNSSHAERVQAEARGQASRGTLRVSLRRGPGTVFSGSQGYGAARAGQWV